MGLKNKINKTCLGSYKGDVELKNHLDEPLKN